MLVALFRGINVGRAKRVAMADLRALAGELGYHDARTLLNSGNLVFSAPGVAAPEAAARIQEGLATRIGVPARVTVLTGGELLRALSQNPLMDIAENPSRMLVAVLSDPADRAKLLPLLELHWAPEAFAVGERVAYLWCPDGVLSSPLGEAVNRALGDAVTTRNWSTLTKLGALL